MYYNIWNIVGRYNIQVDGLTHAKRASHTRAATEFGCDVSKSIYERKLAYSFRCYLYIYSINIVYYSPAALQQSPVQDPSRPKSEPPSLPPLIGKVSIFLTLFDFAKNVTHFFVVVVVVSRIAVRTRTRGLVI